MKRLTLFVACAVLGGCAASAGIVPAGQDTYMLSRSGYGFGEASSNVKAKIIGEASAHCSSMGKSMEILSSDDKPGWPGHFPEAEVRFKCVAMK